MRRSWRVRGDLCYAAHVIARYTPADFAELWSPARRFAIWLEVELAACEAMEDADLVPRGTAATIRGKKIALDPARWVSLGSAAGVIAFLLSDAARDVSGAAIPLYGRA